MYKKITAVAMGAAFAVMTASAAIIAQYDYDITKDPANGTGVTDWTAVGIAGGYSDGYDSGNGGWTIVDGSTGAGTTPSYTRSLSAADTALMANGWTMTWTVAVNADATLRGGTGSNNYYLPPNHSRQSNNALWLENKTGGYTYILTYKFNSSGNVLIHDGTSDIEIIGGAASHQIGTPDMHYLDFSLVYDAGTKQATLSEGTTSYGVVKQHAINAQNRMLFGAFSAGGQGSTTWNEITLDAIPEPATLGLVAAFGGAVLFLRRKLML